MIHTPKRAGGQPVSKEDQPEHPTALCCEKLRADATETRQISVEILPHRGHLYIRSMQDFASALEAYDKSLDDQFPCCNHTVSLGSLFTELYAMTTYFLIDTLSFLHCTPYRG